MSIKVLKILSVVGTVVCSCLGLATNLIDGKVAEKNDIEKWAEIDNKLDAKVADAILKATSKKD